MLRASMSPELAAAVLEAEATKDVDYAKDLSSITAPTLVLHPRAWTTVSLSVAQQAAAYVPHSRFLPLEPGLDMYGSELAETIISFLDEERAGRPAAKSTAAPSNVVAVLFTDIADSTALTQRLGDAKAQELVRMHNAIVRKALRQHGGSEIKHTGDGIMASFQSASGALECAINIQRAVSNSDPSPSPSPAGRGEHLAIHIGLNAGEPIAEENDLFGTAVQLARRICDAADAGEVLASDVVRQLAAGKGYVFEERADATLKGFDEPVGLYEVRWREDE